MFCLAPFTGYLLVDKCMLLSTSFSVSFSAQSVSHSIAIKFALKLMNYVQHFGLTNSSLQTGHGVRRLYEII